MTLIFVTNLIYIWGI